MDILVYIETDISCNMSQFHRRKLLKLIGVSSFFGIFAACDKNVSKLPASAYLNLKPDPEAMALSRSMTKEQVLAMLNQRAAMVMTRSHNCAQSTFFALSEQFGLGGDDVLKALTPLPGLGERGQTCGALTGGLMAIGMIYGRKNLEDWHQYRNSLVYANKFCVEFEKEFGTTKCCEIQEHAFGQSFNLMDENELIAFQKAGATNKCTEVVQKSCRLAAEIILEDQNV